MGVVAGVWSASDWLLLTPGWLAALLALGLCLGIRGRLVTWFAVGAWAVAVNGPSGATPFDPSRPVIGIVETTGFSRRHQDLGSARLTVWTRVRAVGQGSTFYRWRASMMLSLPATDHALSPGTMLRVRGYLRRAVAPNNGTMRPDGIWRLRVESKRFVEPLRDPPAWRRPWARGRARIEASLEAGEGQGAALARRLVRTLVLGDSSALPEHLLIGLRRAGLAHVTAVSGLHVGMLAAAMLWLFARAGRTFRLVLAAIVVLGYVGVAGTPASALRAAGMIFLVLLALAAERPPTPRNALAVTVIVLILADPETLHRLGFQLSVVATGGILILGPSLAARLSWLPRGIRLGLAATLAAQVVTLPLTVPRFAVIAPVAPLLNLLLAPWLAVTLMAVGLWTGLALLTPDWAQWALPLLEPLAEPLVWLAAVPASPLWTWTVLPSLGWPLGLLGLVSSWVLRWRAGVALVLAMALLALPHAVVRPEPSITMLDVGQGDAMLVRDGRRAVLIDGGGWRYGDIAGAVLVPALARLGVHRLEALILTHPDLDHCAGLLSVARYLPAKSIWLAPGWRDDDPCIQGLGDLPGVPMQMVVAGDERRLGRWRLRVLHPAREDLEGTTLGRNDRSLVIRASVHGRGFLLTGDLGRAGERALLGRPRDGLPADVLKLAHHGSASSSGRPFLASVDPRLAINSAGRKNRFGHPAAVVRERLARLGIPLLRTDQGGAVTIRVAANGNLRITRPPW